MQFRKLRGIREDKDIKKKDIAKYYGPFMNGVSVSEMLDVINSIFMIRPCTKVINPEKPFKECLNYHIKLCPAPCNNKCDQTEYMQRVKKAIESENNYAKRA